jgi:hypothetical protein
MRVEATAAMTVVSEPYRSAISAAFVHLRRQEDGAEAGSSPINDPNPGTRRNRGAPRRRPSHNQAHTGECRIPAVIGRPELDFNVAGTVLLAAARNVSGRQRLGFCLGSDLGENAPPHLDPRRKRVTTGIDCVAEQPSECVGFLIGEVEFHIR